MVRTNLLLWVVFWFLLPLCRGDIDTTKHEVDVFLKGNFVRDRSSLAKALQLFHSKPRNFSLSHLANEERKNSIHYFDLWVSNPADYKPFACRLSLVIKYNETGRISSIDFIEDFDENIEEMNAYFSAFTRIFLILTQYGSPLRIIGRTSSDIGKLLETPESYIEIATEPGLMKIVGVERAEMFRLASKVLIGIRGIQKIVLEKCGPELKNFDLVGGLLVKTDPLFGEIEVSNNVITELIISDCQMGGNMPKNLQLLSELKVIKLINCEGVDVKKICLEKEKVVESLVLKKSKLSKQDFIELAKSLSRATVVDLDLSSNNIDSITLRHLYFLVKLCKTQQINLTNNHLSHKSKTLPMSLLKIVRF